jgi:hypothetical protein
MKAAAYTPQSFMVFWNDNYPETPPVNYHFKHYLHSRWLRIHSLPGAKRYADSSSEWDILLQRQNTLIADFVAGGEPIKVVVNFIEIDNPLFNLFDFTNIGVFKDMEAETVFQSFLFEVNWQPGILNQMLTMIARDDMRAFIISSNCLIAPYDGGVDIIVQDTPARDACKIKYKEWLSPREDGL